MPTEFALALLRGRDHYWRVSLSNQKEEETFVGRNGALAHVENFAKETPVQLVTLSFITDRVESVWFYAPNKPKRQLNVLLIGEANCHQPEGSTDFVVMLICPSKQFPGKW